jgi:hypothetical protein
LKRIGLGTLSVEEIPRGRYRLLAEQEVDALRKGTRAGTSEKEDKRRDEGRNRNLTQRTQRRMKRKADSSLRSE